MASAKVTLTLDKETVGRIDDAARQAVADYLPASAGSGSKSGSARGTAPPRTRRPAARLGDNRSMKTGGLYQRDFAEWARQNAELLRSGRVGEADIENIAEEIADMSKRERRALEDRLVRLLQHLLKWQAQPVRRSASWRRTIVEQRFRLRRLLTESPSLSQDVPCLVAAVYPHAVRLASLDTGLPESTWPPTWPWSSQPEILLDESFYPDDSIAGA